MHAKRDREKRTAQLWRVLILGCLLLQINLTYAGSAGHQTEFDSFDYNNVRTLTYDPNSNPPLDTTSYNPDLLPGRDAGSGDLRWSIYDENGITERLALSDDGLWLAVSYYLNDERLELWSTEDSSLVFTYEVEDGDGRISMSGDGSIVAYSIQDSIRLFNRDGEGVPYYSWGQDGYRVGPVQLTKDAELMIATGVDTARVTNRVWGFETGSEEPMWTFEVDADEAYGWYGIGLAESAGIIVVNGKYHMYVLDMESGELIWEEPTYNTESPVVISDDGNILVCGTLSGRLRVLGRIGENGGYAEIWHYSFRAFTSSWVTECAVSHDGSLIAAGTLDFYEETINGKVALFDTYGAGDPLWIVESLGDEVAGLDFDRAGEILAVTTWGDQGNQKPDLIVFEAHSRESIYELISEGSLAGVILSEDGSRVVAGGKSTHNRVFGRGGYVFIADLDLLDGFVSGVVTDSEGDPIPGVLISAEDNPYTTLTDENGNYLLRVEVLEVARDIIVTASLQGYMSEVREDEVWEEFTTEDVDFTLEEADPGPEWIRASQNERNEILLNWEEMNGFTGNQRNPVFASKAKQSYSVDGTERLLRNYVPRNDVSITPWHRVIDSNPSPQPHRDDPQSYNIYRSMFSGGPYRIITEVDADENEYIDRDRVFPLHQYYYVVTAVFDGGESFYSEEAVGWVDDDFLNWTIDLESMPESPELDGIINDEEWEGAVLRDISDVFGYDNPDTAGTVIAKIGFNDGANRMYIGVKYLTEPEILERMGLGIYVDDDGDREWTWDRLGSEGNYWGYWVEGEPVKTYRSLSGPPYDRDPYYVFEEPELAFGVNDGHVEIEIAIPLGFHSTEEVAVYGPDSNIGLAMFAMKRDEDENPIFNGWWPQNVLSIVSNNYQYARVHIPVNLVVPPDAPSDVQVERDDNNLLVSWLDPELGIDNNPVQSLDGLEIRRNGELVFTADAEVGEWIDTLVEERGWYEYSLTGFILEDDEPFYGPTSSIVGAYAAEDPDVDELSHDDGTVDRYYIVNGQGPDNRFATRYELEPSADTLAVYWVDFFPRSPDPINVYIAEDEDGLPGDIIGEMYTAHPDSGEVLHRFHYPDVRQPVIYNNVNAGARFWVVLKYLEETPGWPSIGVDRNPESVNAEINKFYTEEGGWTDMGHGQLVIRIAIDEPTEPPIIIPPPDPIIPEVFRLGNAFPNPFNGVSLIPIDIPEAVEVEFRIYTLTGKLLQTTNFGTVPAGLQKLPVDASSLPAGLYFVDVNAGVDGGMLKVVQIK